MANQDSGTGGSAKNSTQAAAVVQGSARNEWLGEFSRLVTGLEEEMPRAYAWAELVDPDSLSAVIAFKGDVPETARIRAAAVRGGSISLRGGFLHSRDNIDDLVIRSHMAVRSDPDLTTSVVTGYDRNNQVVTMAANPADATVLGDVSKSDALRSRLTAMLPADVRGRASVTIQEVRAEVSSRGGGRLEDPNSGALRCTAGYAGYRMTYGTQGMLTAGHCSNGPFRFRNFSTATGYTATFYSEHMGYWGDFQFMTIADTEEDDYYRNWNSYVDLGAIASPYANQTLCRFGHTTGNQCDTVDELTTCVTYTSPPNLPEMCRLVQMDHREADPGDSGGPWWDPATGYGIGIHSGWKQLVVYSDLFSRTMYADEASAVIILR